MAFLENVKNELDDELKEKYLECIIYLEFVAIGAVKFFFLICAMRSFLYYNNTGYFNRKIIKWSNSFFIKLITCILISINYSSMAFIFTDILGNYSYLFFFNSGIWVVSGSLLYFEFRRKLPQSWLGLRLFWLLNGILYFSKIIFISAYFDDYSDAIYNMLILELIQSILSMFLLYYSIFQPKDYELNQGFLEDLIILEQNTAGYTSTQNNYSFADLEENKSTNRVNIQNEQRENLNNHFPIKEIDKHGNIHSLTCNVKNDNKKLNFYPMIVITITNIKPRKISIVPHSSILKNKKLRIKIKINLPKKHKQQNQEIMEVKQFSVKRSLIDIIRFNFLILEKLENKIHSVSPLKLQLKNVTSIISKLNQELCDRIKPDDNSQSFSQFQSFYSKGNENSINESVSISNMVKLLESSYVNLTRNFIFFLPEFLKFLEVRDDNLIEAVSMQLEKLNSNFYFQNSDSNPNIAKIAEGGSTEQINSPIFYDKNKNSKISRIKSRKSKNNFKYSSNKIKFNSEAKNENFYSEKDSQSQNDNDLVKTMMFINNILTNEINIKVFVINIVEKKNFDDSLIHCDLLINNFSKSNSVKINFTAKKLLDYIEKISISKTQIIIEIKTLLTEKKNLLLINKEKNPFKKKFGHWLTKLVNDLFFLDNNLIDLLEMNKFLNLELPEIDEVILNSFFDLDRRSSLNLHVFNTHILKEKNMLNFKITCEFEKIEKMETQSNCSFFVIFLKLNAMNITKYPSFKKEFEEVDISTLTTDDNLNWDVDICLNDIKASFIDIIEINNNYNRFYDLSQELTAIIKCIDNLMKNAKLEKKINGTGNSDIMERISITSYNSKDKDQSGVIRELILRFNNLFIPPYIYVLYSKQVRSFFNIPVIFSCKKSMNSNELPYINCDQIISNSNKSILENLLN